MPTKFLSESEDLLDFIYLEANVTLLNYLTVHFDQPEQSLSKKKKKSQLPYYS